MEDAIAKKDYKNISYRKYFHSNRQSNENIFAILMKI